MTPTRHPSPAWDDERLVGACLAGDERAWQALIDKYKNLVYSVPRKYRMSSDDAADVFQAVWIEAYNDLPRLRQVGSLRTWLLTIASHQAFHWKRRYVRHQEREGTPIESPGFQPAAEPGPDLIAEAEREQALRDAIQQLSERCRDMVRMLFFEDPPVPYAEVAARLGLAIGSIGFTRGRCLERLRRALPHGGL